jgi:hypothetical protein
MPTHQYALCRSYSRSLAGRSGGEPGGPNVSTADHLLADSAFGLLGLGLNRAWRTHIPHVRGVPHRARKWLPRYGPLGTPIDALQPVLPRFSLRSVNDLGLDGEDERPASRHVILRSPGLGMTV